MNGDYMPQEEWAIKKLLLLSSKAHTCKAVEYRVGDTAIPDKENPVQTVGPNNNRIIISSTEQSPQIHCPGSGPSRVLKFEDAVTHHVCHIIGSFP